jgi:hypothetical protein
LKEDSAMDRFIGVIGCQDVITYRQAWWITEAKETDGVMDGKRVLKVGDTLFMDDPSAWRFNRRHAVMDIIKKIEAVRAALADQIEEIKREEGVA